MQRVVPQSWVHPLIVGGKKTAGKIEPIATIRVRLLEDHVVPLAVSREIVEVRAGIRVAIDRAVQAVGLRAVDLAVPVALDVDHGPRAERLRAVAVPAVGED